MGEYDIHLDDKFGQMREFDVKQQDTLKPGDQVFVKPRRL